MLTARKAAPTIAKRTSPKEAATRPTKVVVGLGNPGPEYVSTRHNLGWWVLDRFAFDNDFGPFEREKRSWESTRTVAGQTIRLVKPKTYVNRSGLALTRLWENESFDLRRDLLVITDDTNLAVGRLRFRPGGGAGGHNGLKSISAVLGTNEYARLRVGVGVAPPKMDLSEWVLSELPAEDEEQLSALLPELSQAVAFWARNGVKPAMNSFNR